MGSPFSHCAVLGAECLSSLYPRPLNGNLEILAELPPRCPLTVPAGTGCDAPDGLPHRMRRDGRAVADD